MEKLRHVSEDITDVMQCIEQMGGIQKNNNQSNNNNNKKHKKEQQLEDEIEDPIEEAHVLNNNLCKWQKDASKRMKNVSVTVSKLQNKLEELDEYAIASMYEQERERDNNNQTEIDKAMDMIENLKSQVQQTKME